MTSTTPADRRDPPGPRLMEVTNAVVSACKLLTGKGPTRAKAYLSSDELRFVLGDWITVGERTLVAHGRKDLVAEARRHLHQQVVDTARSSIEEATDRTVLGTRSHLEFDRGIAVLVFILGPAAKLGALA